MRRVSEVRDRTVERAGEGLPAAADSRDPRPGGDDVADRLALVVQLLDRREIALEPGQHVDADVPPLVRLGASENVIALPFNWPGFEKTRRVPRSPRGSVIDSWRRSTSCVVGAVGGRLRGRRIAEREVVQLHRAMSAKSASASSATSTSSRSVDSLRSDSFSCSPAPTKRSRAIEILIARPFVVPFRR